MSMLNFVPASEEERRFGERAIVYKKEGGKQHVGSLRIAKNDEATWVFRAASDRPSLTTAKLSEPADADIDLTAEELQQLSEVAFSRKLPK
jgi:hypothetical protein